MLIPHVFHALCLQIGMFMPIYPRLELTNNLRGYKLNLKLIKYENDSIIIFIIIQESP